MSQTRCPRCGSDRPCKPNPVSALSHYTCRDAWHMPSLSTEAAEAIEFAKAVDEQFQQDIPLDPEALAFDPYRHATAEYPR